MGDGPETKQKDPELEVSGSVDTEPSTASDTDDRATSDESAERTTDGEHLYPFSGPPAKRTPPSSEVANAPDATNEKETGKTSVEKSTDETTQKTDRAPDAHK